MRKTTKQAVAFLLAMVLTVGAVPASQPDLSAQAATKSDSKEALMAKWTDNPNVLYSYYADYDGDGKKEIFAITGESEQNPDTIYFSSIKWAGKLNKELGYAYIESGKHICKISGKAKLFVMEFGAGGSGSHSVCYYVKNGKPYQTANKFLEGLMQLKGKDFAIHPSAFDWDKTTIDGISTGHTWKRYWVKWNGKKFVEYKGKYISQKTLEKYSNGTQILKKVKKLGYSVGKIIKRGNGIININLKLKFSDHTRYDNVTLLLKKKKLTVQYIKGYNGNIVERSSYGGIYRKSIL